MIAFVLGVAVTYAEPAISSLTPLVSLVKVHRAPYLHYVLMELREVLVLCIGLGVGFATGKASNNFLIRRIRKRLQKFVQCIVTDGVNSVGYIAVR